MYRRASNLGLRKWGSKSFSTAKMAAAVDPGIQVKQNKLYIDGNFVDAVSGKTYPTFDPRTDQPITQFACAGVEDVNKAVESSRKAFDEGPWPRLSGFDRSKILWKVADLIERDFEYLQRLETWDTGKPLSGSWGDVTLAIEHFRYYAGWADKVSQGKVIPMTNLVQKHFCYTLHEPIGVVGAIIPWNFPMLMMTWKVAPALATGNTIVIKAAETSPLTALHLASLLEEAGVPKGVVNVVPGLGEEAGAALSSHAGVDKIAFTGETVTGIKIMQAAAQNLKPVTLELGGKSPAILLPDCDIDKAVFWTEFGLFLNKGECCCAGSMVYCHESIYDEYIEKLTKKIKERRVGDPFTDVDQGPQQNKEQFEKVLKYFEKGQKEGAKCAMGGKRHGDTGYYVEPTLWVDVNPNMCIAKEEIFGPSMQVSKYSDFDEMLKSANSTEYGLAASVHGKDINKITQYTRALKAGTVWVNCHNVFDSGSPFGGYKKSGIGREKGEYALSNFTQTKCVIQTLPNDGGWY